MTTPTGPRQRRTPRRRTVGVAPYEPGRTTAEYIAAGAMTGVEADDEVAALMAYADSRGLTLAADPVRSKSGKRVQVTLSDGRDYVARFLRAAVAEFLPPELVLEAPITPRRESADAPAASASDPETAPDAPPAAPVIAEPPEAPEFVQFDAVSPADLTRLRTSLPPRTWDIAAALWGIDGAAPEPVQLVAERFGTTAGFVRMVAESVIRLAATERPPMS